MNLNEKIKHLPDNAGVYIMKNEKKEVIYVGKAKNLKKRVSSYFRTNKNTHIKTMTLVKELVDFTVMIVATEVDALLLERSLIKHHKPKFNILLRDDKEYPLVRSDLKEDWPRIKKVRKLKKDGAEYIGPFAHAGQLSSVLELVYESFPLIRCSEHEFKYTTRPCNYYTMKKCLAPCTLPVDKNHYKQVVKDALSVLKGKKNEVISLLNIKMTEAAKNQNYELAGQFRDQLFALKNLQKEQNAIFPDLEEADVIACETGQDYISFHVLIVRNNKLLGYDHFDSPLYINTKEEALEIFLLQYYESRELAKKIIVPFPLLDLDNLSNALGCKASSIKSAHFKTEKHLSSIAHKNVEYRQQEYLRKQDKINHVLKSTQTFLKLDNPPKKIECIDISHWQGQATVASLVVFVDAKPCKRLYRMYSLDHMTSPDDFASIHEVVERRIRRGLDENNLPDLLIIDGGKGQLKSAETASHKFKDLKLPIISLAKSRVIKKGLASKSGLAHSEERIFTTSSGNSIPLEHGSSVFRLFTQLRDEAHRFAITHHRKKRKKTQTISSLDKIKGIGPVLKKRILTTFSSLEDLAKADIKDLQKVKGLSKKTAEDILKSLQSEK